MAQTYSTHSFPLAVVVILVALASMGCREAPRPSAPPSALATPKTYGKFDWLPNSVPASTPPIPKDAHFTIQIPKNDPLKGKSSGWGVIDTNGNLLLKEKKDYVVSGGSLITRLGPLEKRATYGDWDFVYQDADTRRLTLGFLSSIRRSHPPSQPVPGRPQA